MDLFKDQAGLFGCFSCSSVHLSFVFFGLTPTTESRRRSHGCDAHAYG